MALLQRVLLIVGDGSTSQRLTPVQVSGLTSVTALSAGFYHSLARRNDGTVWAWGSNSDGQLGNGEAGYQSPPKQLLLP